MPVEAVELVHGHNVEVALDRVDAEEMARAVQVHSAVCETRLVGNDGTGQVPVGVLCEGRAVDGLRQHLLERRDRIQYAVVSGSVNLGGFLAYLDAVLLVAKARITDEYESLDRAGLGRGDDADRNGERTDLAGHDGHPCGEVLDRRPGAGVEGRVAVDAGSDGLESPFLELDALRLGDDVKDRILGGTGEGHEQQCCQKYDVCELHFLDC